MKYRFTFESTKASRPEDEPIIKIFGSTIQDVIVETEEDIEDPRVWWQTIESANPHFIERCSWDCID